MRQCVHTLSTWPRDTLEDEWSTTCDEKTFEPRDLNGFPIVGHRNADYHERVLRIAVRACAVCVFVPARRSCGTKNEHTQTQGVTLQRAE